jgi:hypothetical protein
MFWLETAVTVVVGLTALIAVILTRWPTVNNELGSVSRRWVIEHRVDSR